MTELPPLPFEQWRPTLDTLHLWAQIVGKIRLANVPPRNHWWHTPLYVSARGLTTRRMPASDDSLEIELDLVDHRFLATTAGGRTTFSLHDGLSVAAFYQQTLTALTELGIATQIRPKPYGVPMTTPFPEDTEHASYDTEAVRRSHAVMSFADTVLQEFSGWFNGKASPVHVFWHSFDVAHSRFVSEQEIAFGFWPGDDTTPAPTFYSYTAPEPEGISSRPLRPAAASWVPQSSGVTAHLPYDAVRTYDDARTRVLDFFRSTYEAGATLSGWDVDGLATDWAPPRTATEGEG